MQTCGRGINLVGIIVLAGGWLSILDELWTGKQFVKSLEFNDLRLR